MTRDKKFLKSKSDIVEMLELGVPPSVMMEYFSDKLSISSLKKYIEIIMFNGDYHGKIMTIPEARVNMFSLLMKKDIPYFVSLALDRFFKLEELFPLLGYARYQLNELTLVAFASEVPAGYQRLINVINGFQASENTGKYHIRHLGKQLFDDCLRAIKDGKKEMPTKKVLENIYDLANFIIDNNDKIIEKRKEIAPFFTAKICKLVDEVLLTITEREALVLRSLYGLNQTKKSHQEIGEDLEMTAERVRQIEQKAIRRCRHSSRANIMGLYPMNWESIQGRMEWLEHLLQEEKNKSASSEV